MSQLDFPLQEYRDRIARIREKMKEKGLDTLIVLGPENIHYVSGFDCAWAHLFPLIPPQVFIRF